MNTVQIKPRLSLWIDSHSALAKATALLLGIVILSLLAQIAIPLPYTPVPITGQTFGVMVLSLNLGRKWGFATIAGYIALGAIGLPIFSSGQAGLRIVTSGYLVGMAFSSIVIGTLADRGWTTSFGKSLSACLLGLLCIYLCGITILSRFLPADQLLMAGIVPFIPGDLIKAAVAAGIANGMQKRTVRAIG